MAFAPSSRTIALSAVLLAVGVFVVSWYERYRHGAHVDQAIYGDLRAVELEHRGLPLAVPMMLLGSRAAGNVIGVPTDDPRFPNAWIAATPTHANGAIYVMMSKDAHVRIACGRIGRLLDPIGAGASVAPRVRAYLAGVCMP
jgi:hypothetical protein